MNSIELKGCKMVAGSNFKLNYPGEKIISVNMDGIHGRFVVGFHIQSTGTPGDIVFKSLCPSNKPIRFEDTATASGIRDIFSAPWLDLRVTPGRDPYFVIKTERADEDNYYEITDFFIGVIQ